MSEIEVGEYVRINKSSRFLGIGKVLKIVSNTIYVKMYLSLPISFSYEEIKGYKHSKYPIDLIEVGDYVNGYRVVDIMEDMETGEIHLEMTSDYTNEIIGDCTIYNDDIKSILTHEQFESIEYKVESEDK